MKWPHGLILMTGLSLAGCAGLAGKWPAPAASAESHARSEADAESRQVEALLADAPRLIALPAEDARREQAAAAQAVTATPPDAAKLRLAWLLTLGIGGRNDARLLSLLEELPCRSSPSELPLRQLWGVMHRTAMERVRSQQEAQGRSDARLRETEQKLREAQARADDLQQKLDAIMDVERTLNKRSGKRK